MGAAGARLAVTNPSVSCRIVIQTRTRGIVCCFCTVFHTVVEEAPGLAAVCRGTCQVPGKGCSIREAPQPSTAPGEAPMGGGGGPVLSPRVQHHLTLQTTEGDELDSSRPALLRSCSVL